MSLSSKSKEEIVGQIFLPLTVLASLFKITNNLSGRMQVTSLRIEAISEKKFNVRGKDKAL